MANQEKAIPPPPTLFTALKASYQDKGAAQRLTQSGYLQDTGMSDHRQQVWYNPNEKKLLMTVAGTHTRHDILTDARLAIGGLKNTKRYKSAKTTLEAARAKYGPGAVTVTGHSLGGSIAQAIANKNTDRVLAYNSGFTFGGKAIPGKGGEVFRTSGDLVSFLGSGQSTSGKTKNPLFAHRLKNIKSKKIYV
jgi:hypothetical protein